MIKLVLTDLDNTLIPTGAPCASERAIAGIHAMLDAGMHFGPVSGRVPAAMRWMFAGDEACGRTGAYVNGQMVYVDGRLVREEALDGGSLQEVANFAFDWEDVALTVYDLSQVDGANDGTAYFLGSTPNELARHPEVFGENPLIIERIIEPRYVKANLRCAFDSDRYERMVVLRDELRECFPQFSFVFPMDPKAGGFYIDILPVGWDKGKAVLAVAEALDLTPDEVAVFGDSENDLAMFDVVPNSVAVANASEEVAARAHWHIGACADDAAADAFFGLAEAARVGEMPSFMR